jgi:elongator complex protein 3
LLRLRIPSEKAHRPEVDSRTGIVRELHVYGTQVPIGEHDDVAWQHRGWGARLLKTAEEVARYEFSCRKILVLSGVGAREYYRKYGYRRPPGSPYMAKELTG